MTEIPGVDASGVEISNYAIDHAYGLSVGRIIKASAHALPFDDDSFDAVFAVNCLHNLEYGECAQALREIIRVVKSPDKCFVQVDAYRNDHERAQFEAWMLTAKTYLKPEGWQEMFKDTHYVGDYFWTVLSFTDDV